MNLLFANLALDRSWGGGEHWTALTARGLAARGHQVVILTRDDASRFQDTAGADVESVEGIPVSFDYAPRTILAALGWLRRGRPDVVVVHHNKDLRTVGVAAALAGVPVVHRNGFPILRDRVRDQVSHQLVSRILTNSDRIRERYERYGWIDPSCIDVVWNGVSMPRSSLDVPSIRARWGVNDDVLVLLFAGRLTATKRVGDLLDVMARMPAQSRWRLVIAGQGAAEAELRERIVRHGLDGRVHLAGFDPKVREAFGAANLVALPSSQEGMPNALLEAMAAGVPVAATPVGEVETLLDHGTAGWLIPVGDTGAWVRRLCRLEAAPEELRAMGERGRARVEAEFTIDRMLDGVESSLRRARQPSV